jgi:hypothetical protein
MTMDMTIDEKIDAAIDAAFMAMGLSVSNNTGFAIELAEWLDEHAPDYITSDHDDE